MKSRNIAIIAAMSMAFCAPAGANSLTFQGVTFETLSVDDNTLQLTIGNVLSGGTGNWSNATWLGALEIKGIGTVTSATLDSWTGINLTGWVSDVNNGLSGSSVGCTTGGTPGACYTGTYLSGPGPAAMSDYMTFTMSFGGSGIFFDAPELKVQFLETSSDTTTNSSLLSLPIPEPEIYAMLGMGLGLLGWVGRRKRLQAA